MRKHLNEFLAYARQMGVEAAHIRHGKKHPAICGTYAGRIVRFTFAGTPSDRRSMANARASLRRYLTAFHPASAPSA